jgi:DNA-binding transcriptional ArsR family regulator
VARPRWGGPLSLIGVSLLNKTIDDHFGASYFTNMLINQTVKYQYPAEQLNEIFYALSDPTRRMMLEILARGEATVNQLAAPFDLSLPAISKHLKVLEKAGLISRAKAAQFRPCRIEPEALAAGADYMNQYALLWQERLAELESYLAKLQQDNNKEKTHE